jgi:tetratricopeptide (TPR) repeat protein
MRYVFRLICLWAVSTQLVIAQTNDIPGQLRSGDYQSVDAQFSAVQSEFEKGRITEFTLLDLYKVFYQRQDNLRAELNAWVKAYPKSSSAYLARGVYFRKLGEFKRGTNYISQVPPESIQYMAQMFTLAKRDLETALRLNPRSYLAVVHLLNIAQFEGDDDASDRYLQLGNALQPSNLLVRARYLIHLTPRWGGSYASMDQFIDGSRAAGLAANQVDLLRAILLNDQGSALLSKGDWQQARRKYEGALQLSMAGGPRFRRDYLNESMQVCSDTQLAAKEYCQ